MTNNGREPLISKDENTANAVTEVTEEDLRSAVQKISSLATVVRPKSQYRSNYFKYACTTYQQELESMDIVQ